MNNNGFYGALIAGEVQAALALLEEPERRRCLARLNGENPCYPVESPLDEVLAAYQDYWRAAIYRKEIRAEAALRQRFCQLFAAEGSLEELEETRVKAAFAAQGLHFLGGRTGCFGKAAKSWKAKRDKREVGTWSFG